MHKSEPAKPRPLDLGQAGGHGHFHCTVGRLNRAANNWLQVADLQPVPEQSNLSLQLQQELRYCPIRLASTPHSDTAPTANATLLSNNLLGKPCIQVSPVCTKAAARM